MAVHEFLKLDVETGDTPRPVRTGAGDPGLVVDGVRLIPNYAVREGPYHACFRVCGLDRRAT